MPTSTYSGGDLSSNPKDAVDPRPKSFGSNKMATYSMTAPDGGTYKVDGPEGATDDEVRAEILRQHPDAGTPQQKSFMQSIGDAFRTKRQPGDPLFAGALRAAGNYDVARGTKTPEEAAENVTPYMNIMKNTAGITAGGGAGAALKAGRLAPAIGRIVGAGVGGATDTPGEGESRTMNALKAAGSAAGAEAALPLLMGGGKMLPGAIGKLARWAVDEPAKPGMTATKVDYVPRPVEKPMVVLPGPQPVAPTENIIPHPTDPRLMLKSTDTLNYHQPLPSKVKGLLNVPPTAQTAMDVAATTPAGENTEGFIGLLSLQNLLKKYGVGSVGGSQHGGSGLPTGRGYAP